MVHPLQSKVRRVGRQARLLLLVRGGASFLTLLLAAGLIAGVADFLLRWQDRGLRTFVSLAALSIVAYSFARCLLPILRYRPSDVTMARWLEARHPQWRDQLSSALAFLQSSPQDTTAGSAVLREAHIERIATELEPLSVRACLRMSSPLRPLLWAAILGLLGCTLVMVDPVAAQLATLRLIAPWSSLTWPRRHELTFVQTPERIASGQDFESAVIDRHGNLPPAVNLWIWYDGDSEEQIHQYPMKYAGGRMVHRLGNVTRSLRYRAVGGDDDTLPWRSLEVVAPPELESVTARITPPAYANWPAYEASGSLQALAGSRIELVGQTSIPVRQVILRADTAGVFSADIDLLGATLDKQRTQFAAPDSTGPSWIVGTSGKYWLEFITPEQLTVSTTPWEIRAVPDEPPSISLSPLSKGGVATRRAVISFQLVAKDDLALQRIDMQVRVSGETEPLQVVRVWQGPDEAPPLPASSWPRGDERTVTGQLDLASLPNLAEGKTIEVEIVAEDYKPQQGRAESQRLRIISDADLEDRLTQLQSQLIQTIDHALKLQREARGQTRDVESQLREAPQFAPRQLDALKGAELHQRQVADRLRLAPDSAAAQVQVMLDELQWNRIVLPDVVARLQSLHAEIVRIGDETLPAAQRQLLSSIKSAPSSDEAVPSEAAFQQSLSAAAVLQDQAVEQLEALAGELAEWEGYRRFAGEFRDLLREQIRLGDETRELHPLTLGHDLDELTPQHRAQLRRIAQRQMDLARRFDGLRSRLTEKSKELAAADPPAAQALLAAVDVADRRAVGARMRDSAGGAEQNQLGRAMAGQDEARSGLEEILDALSHNRRRNAAHEQRLNDAARTVAELRRKQDDIDGQRKALAAAPADSGAAKAGRAAQQIAAADAAASDRVAESGRAMGQAAEHTANRQFDQAGRDAEQAQQLLAEAEAMLAASAQQADQEALRKERAALEQGLAELHAQQSALQQRTRQLAQRWRMPNAWTAQEEQGLREAADQQRTLAQQAITLKDELRNWPLFRNQLAQAAQEMNEAARPMAEGQLGDVPLQAQQLAVERLSQMIAALQSKPNQNTEEQANAEASPPGAAAGQTPQGPQLSIEELELMHLMQSGLLDRTRQLDSDRSNNSVGEDEAARRQQQIASEQGRLAQLLMDLIGSNEQEPAEPLEDRQPVPPASRDADDALRELDRTLSPPREPESQQNR
jgi:hypothetical protein